MNAATLGVHMSDAYERDEQDILEKIRELQQENAALRFEVDRLKVKLFDLEHEDD